MKWQWWIFIPMSRVFIKRFVLTGSMRSLLLCLGLLTLKEHKQNDRHSNEQIQAWYLYQNLSYNLVLPHKVFQSRTSKKLLSVYHTYFQDVINSNQTIEWDIWNVIFVARNIYYPLHAWLISTWRNVAWILIISKNKFIHSDYDHLISFDVRYRQSI